MRHRRRPISRSSKIRWWRSRWKWRNKLRWASLRRSLAASRNRFWQRRPRSIWWRKWQFKLHKDSSEPSLIKRRWVMGLCNKSVWQRRIWSGACDHKITLRNKVYWRWVDIDCCWSQLKVNSSWHRGPLKIKRFDWIGLKLHDCWRV